LLLFDEFETAESKAFIIVFKAKKVYGNYGITLTIYLLKGELRKHSSDDG